MEVFFVNLFVEDNFVEVVKVYWMSFIEVYVIFIIGNLIIGIIFYVKFVNIELKEEVILFGFLVIISGEVGWLEMYVDFLEVLVVDLLGVIMVIYENVGDIDIVSLVLVVCVIGG